MIKVNALGDACPIPVVKTKNAIRELGSGGVVEVSVDNEIAVQNLNKMAKQKNYEFSYEKKSDTEYIVTVGINSDSKTDTNTVSKISGTQKDEISLKETVVVIDSDKMGDGDEEFSKTLLKGFIYALSSQDIPPAKIIFYNTGVKMTTKGSESIEDLKVLANAGAKIYSCGACLNNYGLTEKLLIGEVTNMYDIAGYLLNADLVVRP
ncbi:selenium metabolism protein YedF [Lachnoanaerobaculum saburreum F0468]|jgi:selenium metabolism protein yedF|uniref:Selenium metabolism protein YedF n=1 Tax=Lachnoanaerobaculum saburreum F0468 TaxID=1095750 RepID=I0RAK8_9FIRM|nr:sulfurtransferase-like selenium metabolism protein YedF [Lachnoanaerobaculum saburreum]EIC96716.1 selenium metabolism protein YedF [Lachnoanaerobaculum saburreum F0468]